jgi:serine/threonine-protein kinase
VKRLDWQISESNLQSETAAKLKERLEKNQDKLFTFLNHDGVPWNNNNAEHAVKAFAALRGISESPAGDAENSPTMTISPTRAGVILGTAKYMAPEQARGKTVDRRADIWAFGCVLQEMLTGRPAFGGETTTDIIAAVVAKEPDLTRVPVEVRIRSRDYKQSVTGGCWWRGEQAPAVGSWSKAPWILGAVVAVAAAAVMGVGWWRATRPVDHPFMRLNLDLGPNAVAGLNNTVAISPDGRRLVFPARGPDGKQQLATRLLDQAQPMLLPGTEYGMDPFFSPDGEWAGFYSRDS